MKQTLEEARAPQSTITIKACKGGGTSPTPSGAATSFSRERQASRLAMLTDRLATELDAMVEVAEVLGSVVRGVKAAATALKVELRKPLKGEE